MRLIEGAAAWRTLLRVRYLKVTYNLDTFQGCLTYLPSYLRASWKLDSLECQIEVITFYISPLPYANVVYHLDATKTSAAHSGNILLVPLGPAQPGARLNTLPGGASNTSSSQRSRSIPTHTTPSTPSGLSSVASPSRLFPSAAPAAPSHHSWRLPQPTAVKKTLKWLGTLIGLFTGALGLISFIPAFEAVDLAKIANTYSKESTELAEWSAMVSFRQDCETRLAAGQSVSPDCSEAVAKPTPRPPYSYVPADSLGNNATAALGDSQQGSLTHHEATEKVHPMRWYANTILCRNDSLLEHHYWGVEKRDYSSLDSMIWRGTSDIRPDLEQDHDSADNSFL